MQTRRQVITAIFAGAAGFAEQAKPNFSGRWGLDLRRSSKDAPANLIETIDHRDPVLRIDTEWDHSSATGVSNAAMLTPVIQLKSDGTETSNETPMGMKLVTKSHWDGNKLVTEWRLDGIDTPMSGTWTRFMTDANTMAVDSVAEGGGHRVTRRFLFVK